MSAAELAHRCAKDVMDRVETAREGPGRPLDYGEKLALVETFVRAAIERALEEAGRSEQRTFVVQGGHVSLDLNLNAKGELQWGAKLMLPVDGLEPERVAEVRELAQRELQLAETFLQSRYGREPKP